MESSPSQKNEIKTLLHAIEMATDNMSSTFQESILRHQEQFIKSYKIKIYELVKLFDQLKKIVEDKFINNAIAFQLETVLKERDYFKYQCLRLNSQHQNLLEDHKNLIAQMANTAEQMNIYKHLLESEKIKCNEIQSNSLKLKKNLTDLASKNLTLNYQSIAFKGDTEDKERESNQVIQLKKELKEKNQIIRVLKSKVYEHESRIYISHNEKLEKKELQELFRVCVTGWKRDLITKARKENKVKSGRVSNTMSSTITSFQSNCSLDQFTSLQKKELLTLFFTHPQFLKFIDRLLFDDGFKVIFQKSDEEKYIQKNRTALYEYMCKRKIHTSKNNR